MNEKIINEEYKIWKKTSPLLYDLIYSYSCDAPSLCVNWLKEYSIEKNDNNEDFINAKLLVGTNIKNEQNHIKLVSVNVPPTLSNKFNSKCSIPNNLLKSRQLNITREWNHPGEVNKLQINQFNNLIATQTNNGDILLFDMNDKESKNHKSVLKFHSKEGFGLEWNPNNDKQNLLLSSSEDCKIAIWDINNQKLTPEIKPIRTIESHDNIVNDVSWNKSISSIFASVSDDSSYQIHDLRLSTGPILHITNAHHEPDSENQFNFPINSVDFNDSVSTLFATGGADNYIQLWDLRNPTIPLRRLSGHKGPVVGLKFHENYLLSSSIDNRVLVWDINKLDEGEPDRRKTDYVDPCLAFLHGGHTGKIYDADWHPDLQNLIVSCAEDGLLEVWRPSHLDDEYIPEQTESEEHVKSEAKDNDNDSEMKDA